MTPQPNKKSYTNGDIVRRLDNMSDRIGVLETWKISQDAGKAAVDEYKRQEIVEKNNNARSSLYIGKADLFKYGSLLLAALTTAVYAYLSRSHP